MNTKTIFPFLPCLDIVESTTSSTRSYSKLPTRMTKKFQDEAEELAALFGKKLDLSDDFAFLNDEATISFVRKSKIMIINRGLPGSGKTTLCKKIIDVYGHDKTVVCSGDDYFVSSEGVYKFDVTRIADAHNWAQDKAYQACRDALSPVIIDNTNIKYWEIKKYLDIARTFDYIVLLVEPKTPHKFDLDKLVELNKHNVPRETIARRLAEYQIIYPLYFGWFLNTHDSAEIVALSRKVFNECVNVCRGFRNDLMAKTGKEPDQLFDYEIANILHCTAKYLGRNYSNHQDPYLKNQKVLSNMGKVDQLQIVGISITNKTLAAIVDLNSSQIDIWNNELDYKSMHRMLDEADVLPGQMDKRAELFKKLKRGERAHLTVGLAANTYAVESGCDLIRNKLKTKHFKMTNRKLDTFKSETTSKIVCLGDCSCLAYFEKPIVVNCIFSGDY